ncbi:MAG: acetate--CoA ligase family protein [Candidatus Micrarchaeota archaeon]
MGTVCGASSMDFGLLEKYKIPIIPCKFAYSQKGALEATKKLGYPVALKLISPHFLHKSEHHALSLNLKNPHSVASEYLRLQKMTPPNDPILVQKFLPSSLELILGGKTDSQFGPTIMLGLGGIYTEILHDMQIRVCPPTDSDIRSMISSLQSFPIIKGTRGQKGADLTELVKILRNLSNLMEKEQPKEIDINPMLLTKEGLVAADVRILW